MHFFEQRTPIFHELGLRSEAVAPLRAYVEMLWKSNQDLNLFSRQMSFEELIDNHVIDCLMAVPHFPQGLKCVADFGSGGGLPGVLFAIQFPELTYRLYEKSPKKQEFLKSCEKLAPNLQVHGDIPKNLGDVQLVTARAFKPLDVILDMSRSYYAQGGSYFLLKGRLPKIHEEIALARKKFKDLQDSRIRIQVLKSPVMDVERHLVVIQ
jgi:16S rRNA (guanine527-N7)-methyltransferase